MAQRKKSNSKTHSKQSVAKTRVKTRPPKKAKRPSPKIAKKTLEKAIGNIARGYSLEEAARSIRVTPERLKTIGQKEKLLRKSNGKWIVAGRLARRMILFSNGSVLIVTTRSKKSASLIGRYMSAVRQFLRTNKPEFLTEFSDSYIKDTAGKIHRFETDPNALYRIANAGGDHFEEIYRIVI